MRNRLLALAQEHSTEEIMVVSITHDFKARLRSYQLLAEAFGLHGLGAESRTSR